METAVVVAIAVVALAAAVVVVVDVEATVVVETAAFLAVLEAIVSTVAVVETATAVTAAPSTTCFAHLSAIYQNGAASLYSLGSMVKKSSSFHCSVSKVGRRIGSLFQHSSMISYRATLQLGGCGIR